MAVIVVHLVVGVWLQRVVPVFGLAVGCLALSRWSGARPRWSAAVLIGFLFGLLGSGLSVAAWDEVRPDRLGPFVGWSCLVTDPTPRNGSVVAVFDVEGERFEAWARGSPRRRLTDHLAGECAQISADRRVISGSAARRAAVRHIVGGLHITAIGEWAEGPPMSTASNRVRRLFAAGAARLSWPDRALFAGLVIGDDRDEPQEMIDGFRASGLSHLTAVSGSNVAFVLAAAAPLLRRLKPLARWIATIAVIGWFVALTRFEPSILRAGVMAGIASTGYLLGRERPPRRVLTLAVGLLVLVDPLLVWSVGFWLSVAATAGVAVLSGPLARLIPGPHWLALPIGVTLGAQLAVAPISLVVFGSLPLVSIPANLLAVPVAGVVMLYGLPAGLLAGALSDLDLLGRVGRPLGFVVQLPSAAGTHWVATVAAVAAKVEPPAPWPNVGWFAVVVFCTARALCKCGQRGRLPDHRRR